MDFQPNWQRLKIPTKQDAIAHIIGQLVSNPAVAGDGKHPDCPKGKVMIQIFGQKLILTPKKQANKKDAEYVEVD